MRFAVATVNLLPEIKCETDLCDSRTQADGRVLIGSRRGPNICNAHGNGPFWTAVLRAKGDFDVVGWLLDTSVNVDHVNRNGRSPKMMLRIIGQGLEELFARQGRTY